MKQPEAALDDLLLFARVAEAASITRVAATTGVSKATISRRLTQFERRLGTRLLKRSTSRITTTAIGERLRQRCRGIQEDVSEALAEAVAQQRELRGTLRVAMPAEIGMKWLGATVAEFSAAHPALEMEVGIHGDALDLRSAPYDLALRFNKPAGTGLVIRRIASMSRGLYAAPDYLAAMGVPREVKALNAHRCITTELQQSERIWLLRQEGRRQRVGIRGALRVNNARLARELVLNGCGIGLLANLLCREDLRQGRLVRLFPDWQAQPVTLNAVMQARETLPRSARAFLEFLAARVERDG